MRRRSLIIALGALVVVLFATTCSKKNASTPTQPAPPSPACSVVPSTIAFGTVTTGTHRDTTVTVSNVGGGTLTGSAGGPCSDFSVVGDSTFSLAAGQSKSVTVRFAPAVAGNRGCTLHVGSGCSVACSGVAEAPPILACDVSPTSLDFGTVPLGQTVDRTFTLKNLSTATMSGTVSCPSADFTIAGAASYSLMPTQTATIIVRFLSHVAGSLSADAQTGQPGCPTVTCSAISQQVCAVSTDHLDFGTVASGTTTKKSFRITNAGSAPISGTVGTDGTCDGFSVEGAPVSYSLAPGQFKDITVDFSPFGGEGAFGCTVLIGGSASCPSVTCTGSAEFPCNCAVSPTSFNFGDVVVGGQTARQFSISTGGETAIGGVISVLGTGFVLSTTANPNIFSTSLGYNVSAGTSQTFNLVFQPQSLGTISAAVAISQTLCTRIGSPCDTLHCTGNGIVTPPPPACAVSTTSLFVGTLHSGQAKDSTFTLTNVGGGSLSGSVSWVGSSYPFSLVGSTSYALSAGQNKSFTVHFFAPSVDPGHTVTYAGTINLGTACAGLGQLTVQGAAVP